MIIDDFLSQPSRSAWLFYQNGGKLWVSYPGYWWVWFQVGSLV